MAQNSLTSGFPCSGFPFGFSFSLELFHSQVWMCGTEGKTFKPNLLFQHAFLNLDFFSPVRVWSFNPAALNSWPAALDDEHKSHSFYQPNIHWGMHFPAPESFMETGPNKSGIKHTKYIINHFIHFTQSHTGFKPQLSNSVYLARIAVHTKFWAVAKERICQKFVFGNHKP